METGMVEPLRGSKAGELPVTGSADKLGCICVA